MKQIGIAIMGIGTVGGGTYDILTQNRDLIRRTRGLDLEVRKILDRSKDNVTARGIDGALACTDLNEIVSDPGISVVVETMGGVEPARTFILRALAAGKSVVPSTVPSWRPRRKRAAPVCITRRAAWAACPSSAR